MSLPMRSTFDGLAAVRHVSGPFRRGPATRGRKTWMRASEAKLTARTMNDLDQVIRLCRSAMDKGLEAADVPFATNLLASTLIQRGSTRMEVLARISPTDLKWNDFRKAALDDLQQGVKLTPEQPEALLSIAQLELLPGGDAKEAAEALGKAIEFAAENPLVEGQGVDDAGEHREGPRKETGRSGRGGSRGSRRAGGAAVPGAAAGRRRANSKRR